jgi:hypothetical protein
MRRSSSDAGDFAGRVNKQPMAKKEEVTVTVVLQLEGRKPKGKASDPMVGHVRYHLSSLGFASMECMIDE